MRHEIIGKMTKELGLPRALSISTDCDIIHKVILSAL